MSIIERNLEDKDEVEVEAAPGHRLYAALWFTYLLKHSSTPTLVS